MSKVRCCAICRWILFRSGSTRTVCTSCKDAPLEGLRGRRCPGDDREGDRICEVDLLSRVLDTAVRVLRVFRIDKRYEA